MHMFVDTGNNSQFYIVDNHKQIIRKSTCRNCNVRHIVRMAENILATYPEITEIRVEGAGIGAPTCDAMRKSDRIRVPVKLYRLRTL